MCAVPRSSSACAAALNPKPRNYHDQAWQKSVTDDQIKKAITLGGAAVGKSPIMPASPDLSSTYVQALAATSDGGVIGAGYYGNDPGGNVMVGGTTFRPLAFDRLGGYLVVDLAAD